jgi:hypothetical protein
MLRRTGLLWECLALFFLSLFFHHDIGMNEKKRRGGAEKIEGLRAIM